MSLESAIGWLRRRLRNEPVRPELDEIEKRIEGFDRGRLQLSHRDGAFYVIVLDPDAPYGGRTAQLRDASEIREFAIVAGELADDAIRYREREDGETP